MSEEAALFLPIDGSLDDFLAHHGVKGMKWGVRRDNPSGSAPKKPRAPRKKPSKETVKNVGIEIGFGSIGPAAVLAGMGPPISIAIGLSAAVLAKPAVRGAIARGSKSSASFMKEVGQTKLSAMKLANNKKQATKKAANEALDLAIEAAWIKSIDERLND